MEGTKKAFGIIYVFFLVSLILSFGVIILNKQSFFEKNLEFTSYQNILSKNMITQVALSLNLHKQNNENNLWYRPFLSCPEEVQYLSGGELISTGKTIFSTGETNYFFCSGILNSENISLYYSGSLFLSGSLGGTGFMISQNEQTFSGIIEEGKSISFSGNIFDNRFIKARTEIQGILIQGTGYQNIFWNNSKINSFIKQNTNNTGSIIPLGDIGSGVLYFDINDSFSGKIVQFDKELFDTQQKLIKVSEWNLSSSGGVAESFLQDDLSFSGSIGTPKVFDFEKNDYAVFLAYNTGSLNNIRYTLKVITETGTGVYINPIRDDVIPWQYLGNTILLQDGQFYNRIDKINNY